MYSIINERTGRIVMTTDDYALAMWIVERTRYAVMW